jgi:enamine deaminase RidA (YjgF/YER057c/UK114 family)
MLLQGYCRAVRVGNTIRLSGTTTTHLPDGTPIGGTSPSLQAVHILDIATHAIAKLGGTMKDVVRTRIMLENIEDEEELLEICKAHGWVFGRERGGQGIRPANTLVGGHKIVGEGLGVEIEFEAVIGCGKEVLRI